MKKKILSILLVLASITAVTTVVYATNTSNSASGKQGYSDGYTYVINNNKAYITEYTTDEEKIRSLVIPDKIKGKPVVYIKAEAFKDIPMKKLTIPESVTTIGESAFYNCQLLEEVTMNCKTIGANAFNSCTALETVSLGSNVQSIGDNAFMNTAIKTVELPKTLKTLGANVFTSCSSLTTINVASGNKAYKSKDGILYTANIKVLVQCPADKSGTEVSIPSGVKRVKAGAFYGNKNFETIKLPSSLKTIESLAFYNTRSLKSIVIPKKVQKIGAEAFAESASLETLTVQGTTIIGRNAFSDITTLKTVSIAGGQTKISSFDGCTGLKTVTLGKKVTSLGAKSFRNCSSLTAIKLPDEIRTLYTSVLQGCTKLESLDLNNVTKINKKALANCTSLKKVTTNTYNLGQYNINSTAFKGDENLTVQGPYGCGLIYFAKNNNIKYKEVSQQQ